MSVHVNTSSPNTSGCSVFTRPSGNVPWPYRTYGRDNWLLPKLGHFQGSSTTSPRPCVCHLSLFSFCKQVLPFFLLRPLSSALLPSKRFPGSFQKLFIKPRFTPSAVWENSAREDSAEGCCLWLLHSYPPWSTASARHLEHITVLQEHTVLSCEMEEEGALVAGRAAAAYSDVAAPVTPVLLSTEWALVSQIMSYLQARRTPLKHFIVGCKS